MSMSKKKDLEKKIRRQLPPITEKFFNTFNKQRQECDITWDEFFERLHNYQDWVNHLFRLPIKSTETDKINAITVSHLLPLWLENMYRNFIECTIKDVHPLKEIKNTVNPGTPAIVIGAGGSLSDNNNLEHLRDSAFYKEKKGAIISTAHSLRDCINAGVVPDYIVLIDEDKIEAEFIDIEDKYMENISCVMTPTIHPAVLKKWKGKKYFYLSPIPEITIPNVEIVLTSLFPVFKKFDCGNNCGTCCWNVARYIGCKEISLLGLDFAFKPDTPVQETPYYHAFRRSYKSEEEMMKKAYRFHTHSFFGTNCYTDDMFDKFMQLTVFLMKMMKKEEGIKTINCSPGIIDDKDIENMWFKDWLAKWE